MAAIGSYGKPQKPGAFSGIIHRIAAYSGIPVGVPVAKKATGPRRYFHTANFMARRITSTVANLDYLTDGSSVFWYIQTTARKMG